MKTNTVHTALVFITCCVLSQFSLADSPQSADKGSPERGATLTEAYEAITQAQLPPSRFIASICDFIASNLSPVQSPVPDSLVSAAGKLGFELLVFRRHRGGLEAPLLNELNKERVPELCDKALDLVAKSQGTKAPAFGSESWETDAWPSLLFAFAKQNITPLSKQDSALVLYQLWLHHNFRDEHLDAYSAASDGIALVKNETNVPKDLMADLYNGLFISQLRLGKFADARVSTSEALALKDSVDDVRKWRIVFNIGLLHDYVGELDGALRYYSQAMEVYVPSPLPDDICTSPPADINVSQVGYAMAMQGAVARKMSKHDEARKKLECGLSIILKTNASQTKVIQIELANLAKETDQIDEALRFVDIVIQSSTTIPPQRLDAWVIQCAVKLERGPALEAKPCLEKLTSLLNYDAIDEIPLSYSVAPEYPIRHFQLLRLLMVYFHEQGNEVLSRRYADAAIQLSELYQVSLSNPQAWNSARQDFVDAYLDIIVGEKAVEDVELAKLFELLEGPYSMEPFAEKALYSVNYQGVNTTSGKQSSTIDSIAAVQVELGSDEAFVRYFHHRNGLYSLVVTKTGSHIYYVDAQDNINRFINEHGEITDSRFRLTKLKAFNANALIPKQLIAPDSGIKKLIIVPDRELEGIPFAALNISERGNLYMPLIRQARVLFTSSAKSYFDTQNRLSDQFSMALFGAPVANPNTSDNSTIRGQRESNGQAADTYAFLSGALDEVKGIAGLFDTNQISLAAQEKATNEFLMSPRSRAASILHIATHGYVDSSNPDGVGIISSVSGYDLSSETGTLSLTDLTGYPLSNQLVVISGCDTLQGKLYVGSGKRSMTRGFLSQGAGAVIGTLWPVQDKSTAKFMVRFYSELKETGDTAEALRKTQEAFSRLGRYKAPKYWAGFVLNSSNRHLEKFEFSSITLTASTHKDD